MKQIKVGVNGYGTIGQRVADEILTQPDMELVGVTAHSPRYTIHTAYQKDIDIFSLDSNTSEVLSARGVKDSGNLDNLLEEVDVVIDCSPGGIGAENKGIYMKHSKVKVIYQGGEKAHLADMSFVSQSNYSNVEETNATSLRVVSCNTTGLVRILDPIHRVYNIKNCTAMLVRRGTDSNDSKKGPINAIKPSFEMPSHHGPDVRTVIPEIEVFSMAVVVPTTLMHVHGLEMDLERDDYTEKDILNLLKQNPRTKVLAVNQGISSTAQVMDYAKGISRNPRGDLTDIGVWDEGIKVYRNPNHNKLFLWLCIHQESDVVPENIDAVRALSGFNDSNISTFHNSIQKAIDEERGAYQKGPLFREEDPNNAVNASRIITDYIAKAHN
jgi:glyceraldehyde-3-phosphate dehydrogenase (NAD(P))